jgi:hypothetical protein
MREFTYYHCYVEELWEAYEKSGLNKDRFGIRIPQSIDLPQEKLFNELLKKDGRLYKFIKEKKCPLYVDRLQGGGYIHEYEYDDALIDEYRTMLGERFLGFQMHEWLSNYKNDVGAKLGELSEEDWTEENIKRVIQKGGWLL